MLKIVVPFLSLTKLTVSQDISNAEDIKILSELSMDRLLSLRNGFVMEKKEYEGNTTESEIEPKNLPHALALRSKLKIKDRGGHSDHGGGGGGGGHYYYEEHYEKGGKKNKIQSIFQLSITSLAFLAFGGYLLCLLIHAIRAKQNYTTVTPAMTQAFTAFVAKKVRQLKNKKRPGKRRKNMKLQNRPNANLQKRPNRNIRKPNKNLQHKKKPNGIRNDYIYGEFPRPMQNRPKRDVYESGGYLVANDYLYHALIDLSEVYTKYNTFDYLEYNKTLHHNSLNEFKK